ncbi:unnamed protein product [Calicophoron daubneyi]|uniref:Uncharacterized protein n=1 Tax=Calicophoron daubneyi TaxID=300641 RepID=A0AAV2THJ0_CALDB
MKAFKFTILTPWTLLPENVPEAECEDKPADEFAQLLCRRTDEELHRRTFWPRTRGESFIKTSFDEFEEKFLRKSEYAVIVLSGTHTSCLDSIYPRLLVFLTVRKTWASRFLLVFLGDPVSGRRFDQKMLTHPPLVFHGNAAEGWRTDNHEWEQLLGVLKKEYIPKSMESLKASGSEVSGAKSEKYYYTPFGSRWLSVSDLRGKPFAVKITERGTHMSWQDVRVDSETWIQTSNQTHRSSAYCDSLSSEPALSQSLPVPELPIKRRRAGSDSKAYSETAVYSYQYEGRAYSADFQSSHDLFSSSLRIESDISPYVRRRLAVAHHRRPRSACQLKIEEKEEDFFTHEIKRNPAYNTSEQMCLPKCILSCQCSRHLAEPSQEEKFKESLDNPSVRDGSSKSLKKSFLQTLNLGRTRRSEPEERHSERTASIPTLKSLKVKAQTFFHPKGKRRGRNVADSLKQAADSLSIFPADVASSGPTSGNRTDAVSAESCPDMYTNLSSHTRKPVVQEHYLEYELHRTQPMHFAQSTPYPQTDEKQGRGPTSYPPGHQLSQISHQQLSVPFTVNTDDFQSNCSTLRIDSGLASLSPAPSDYANESAEQMWTPASNLSSPDVRRDRKNKADHSQLSATYYMLPSTTPCIRRFVKPNQLESIVYKSEITISKGTGPFSVEDRAHTEEERSNQKTLPSATVNQKQKTTMTVPQFSSEQTKMPEDNEDLTSQLYQYKGSLPIVIIKTPEKSANISVERKCITTINNKHSNSSETQTEEQKTTHQNQDTPNKQNTGMKTPDEQQQTTMENTEKQHGQQHETQSQYKQKRKTYKIQTKQITFRTHEHEDQRVCAGEVDEPLGSLATKSETKSIVHGDLGDDNVMISEAAKRGVGAAESSVPGTGKLEDSVDHDAGPGGVSAPFGFGDFAASPLAPEFEQSASVGVSDDSVSAGRVAPETASGLNLDDLSNVPHSADDLHKPESSADETIECRLLPGLEWTVASADAGTDGVGLDVDGDLKMVVTESGSRPLIGDVKTVGEVTEDGEMHETGSILSEHEDQRVCAGEVDEPLGSLATKSETKSIVHGDLGDDNVMISEAAKRGVGAAESSVPGTGKLEDSVDHGAGPGGVSAPFGFGDFAASPLAPEFEQSASVGVSDDSVSAGRVAPETASGLNLDDLSNVPHSADDLHKPESSADETIECRLLPGLEWTVASTDAGTDGVGLDVDGDLKMVVTESGSRPLIGDVKTVGEVTEDGEMHETGSILSEHEDQRVCAGEVDEPLGSLATKSETKSIVHGDLGDDNVMISEAAKRGVGAAESSVPGTGKLEDSVDHGAGPGGVSAPFGFGDFAASPLAPEFEQSASVGVSDDSVSAGRVAPETASGLNLDDLSNVPHSADDLHKPESSADETIECRLLPGLEWTVASADAGTDGVGLDVDGDLKMVVTESGSRPLIGDVKTVGEVTEDGEMHETGSILSEHEDQRVCAGEVDEPLGSLATKSETKSIVHGDLGDDNVMISEAAKRGVGAAESSVPGTGKLEDSVDHDAGPGGVSAPFGFGDFAASPLAPEFEQSASVGVSDDSVSAGRVAPETASGLNLDDLSNVPHSADDLHKPESSADETIECRLLPGLEWTVASADAGTDGVGLDVDGDLKMVVTESGSRPLIGDVKTVGEVTEDGEMHETGSILSEHEDQRVCAGEVDEPLGSLATKSETKSIVHGDLGDDNVMISEAAKRGVGAAESSVPGTGKLEDSVDHGAGPGGVSAPFGFGDFAASPLAPEFEQSASVGVSDDSVSAGRVAPETASGLNLDDLSNVPHSADDLHKPESSADETIECRLLPGLEWTVASADAGTDGVGLDVDGDLKMVVTESGSRPLIGDVKTVGEVTEDGEMHETGSILPEHEDQRVCAGEVDEPLGSLATKSETKSIVHGDLGDDNMMISEAAKRGVGAAESSVPGTGKLEDSVDHGAGPGGVSAPFGFGDFAASPLAPEFEQSASVGVSDDSVSAGRVAPETASGLNLDDLSNVPHSADDLHKPESSADETIECRLLPGLEWTVASADAGTDGVGLDVDGDLKMVVTESGSRPLIGDVKTVGEVTEDGEMHETGSILSEHEDQRVCAGEVDEPLGSLATKSETKSIVHGDLGDDNVMISEAAKRGVGAAESSVPGTGKLEDSVDHGAGPGGVSAPFGFGDFAASPLAPEFEQSASVGVSDDSVSAGKVAPETASGLNLDDLSNVPHSADDLHKPESSADETIECRLLPGLEWTVASTDAGTDGVGLDVDGDLKMVVTESGSRPLIGDVKTVGEVTEDGEMHETGSILPEHEDQRVCAGEVDEPLGSLATKSETKSIVHGDLGDDNMMISEAAKRGVGAAESSVPGTGKLEDSVDHGAGPGGVSAPFGFGDFAASPLAPEFEQSASVGVSDDSVSAGRVAPETASGLNLDDLSNVPHSADDLHKPESSADETIECRLLPGLEWTVASADAGTDGVGLDVDGDLKMVVTESGSRPLIGDVKTVGEVTEDGEMHETGSILSEHEDQRVCAGEVDEPLGSLATKSETKSIVHGDLGDDNVMISEAAKRGVGAAESSVPGTGKLEDSVDHGAGPGGVSAPFGFGDFAASPLAPEFEQSASVGVSDDSVSAGKVAPETASGLNLDDLSNVPHSADDLHKPESSADETIECRLLPGLEWTVASTDAGTDGVGLDVDGDLKMVVTESGSRPLIGDVKTVGEVTEDGEMHETGSILPEHEDQRVCAGEVDEPLGSLATKSETKSIVHGDLGDDNMMISEAAKRGVGAAESSVPGTGKLEDSVDHGAGPGGVSAPFGFGDFAASPLAPEFEQSASVGVSDDSVSAGRVAPETASGLNLDDLSNVPHSADDLHKPESSADETIECRLLPGLEWTVASADAGTDGVGLDVDGDLKMVVTESGSRPLIGDVKTVGEVTEDGEMHETGSILPEHEDQRVCAGEVDEPLGSLATKSETKSIVHGDLGDDNVMISEAAKRGVGAAESSVPGTGKLEDSVDHDAGPGGVSAPFGFGDFAASPLAPEFEQSASVGVSDDSVSAGRVAPETASGLNLDDLSNVPHSADDLHKPESSADETIECRLLPGLEWTVASADAGTDGVGLDVDGDLKMVVTESGSRPLIGDVKTVGEVTEDGEMHETGSILPEHEDQRVCAGEVDEPLGSLATKSETKSIVHGDLGDDNVMISEAAKRGVGAAESSVPGTGKLEDSVDHDAGPGGVSAPFGFGDFAASPLAPEFEQSASVGVSDDSVSAGRVAPETASGLNLDDLSNVPHSADDLHKPESSADETIECRLLPGLEWTVASADAGTDGVGLDVDGDLKMVVTESGSRPLIGDVKTVGEVTEDGEMHETGSILPEHEDQRVCAGEVDEPLGSLATKSETKSIVHGGFGVDGVGCGVSGLSDLIAVSQRIPRSGDAVHSLHSGNISLGNGSISPSFQVVGSVARSKFLRGGYTPTSFDPVISDSLSGVSEIGDSLGQLTTLRSSEVNVGTFRSSSLSQGYFSMAADSMLHRCHSSPSLFTRSDASCLTDVPVADGASDLSLSSRRSSCASCGAAIGSSSLEFSPVVCSHLVSCRRLSDGECLVNAEVSPFVSLGSSASVPLPLSFLMSDVQPSLADPSSSSMHHDFSGSGPQHSLVVDTEAVVPVDAGLLVSRYPLNSHLELTTVEGDVHHWYFVDGLQYVWTTMTQPISGIHRISWDFGICTSIFHFVTAYVPRHMYWFYTAVFSSREHFYNAMAGQRTLTWQHIERRVRDPYYVVAAFFGMTLASPYIRHWPAILGMMPSLSDFRPFNPLFWIERPILFYLDRITHQFRRGLPWNNQVLITSFTHYPWCLANPKP